MLGSIGHQPEQNLDKARQRPGDDHAGHYPGALAASAGSPSQPRRLSQHSPPGSSAMRCLAGRVEFPPKCHVPPKCHGVFLQTRFDMRQKRGGPKGPLRFSFWNGGSGRCSSERPPLTLTLAQSGRGEGMRKTPRGWARGVLTWSWSYRTLRPFRRRRQAQRLPRTCLRSRSRYRAFLP